MTQINIADTELQIAPSEFSRQQVFVKIKFPLPFTGAEDQLIIDTSIARDNWLTYTPKEKDCLVDAIVRATHLAAHIPYTYSIVD
jgi:hypothetical protein